jgi:hypothetical protein
VAPAAKASVHEATSQIEAPPHRQQELYFKELFQLKVQCEYMRRYRRSLSWWVVRFDGLRAVASSGAIATWAIVQKYPLIWGGIIAAAQVMDALKDVIPLTALQKAASALVVSLDALLIDALFEWESVYAGQLSDDEITARRRKLMQLRHDADVWEFPTGDLPERRDLLALAEQDATSYFRAMSGDEVIERREPSHDQD